MLALVRLHRREADCLVRKPRVEAVVRYLEVNQKPLVEAVPYLVRVVVPAWHPVLQVAYLAPSRQTILEACLEQVEENLQFYNLDQEIHQLLQTQPRLNLRLNNKCQQTLSLVVEENH